MKLIRVFTALLLIMSVSAAAKEVAYTINEDPQDLYTIDLQTGATQFVGPTGGDDIDGLATQSINGPLFASDNDTSELLRINPNNGVATLIGAFSGAEDNISDSGLAFAPDGTLFLVDDNPPTLFTVNTSTAVLTLVGTLAVGDIDSIAFNSSGTLYGYDDGINAIITINPSNGAVLTTLGPIGFDPGEDAEQGLSFDSQDNLYFVNESTQSLYSVNTTTGAASLIANTGFDMEALTIAAEPRRPALPAISPLGLILLLTGMIALAWRRFV